MRSFLTTALIAAALSLCPTAAFGQGPKLQLDSLARLESTATEVVDVSLDEKLMSMAWRFLAKADPKDEDSKRAIEVISGIKEIYVRSYKFDAENSYAPADLEMLRSQVKGQGWSRLAGIRNKRDGENAEVYLLTQGDKMLGLAIIAANPKELTVVNIVGSVDVERLSDLDGDFGIPRIELKRDKPAGN